MHVLKRYLCLPFVLAVAQAACSAEDAGTNPDRADGKAAALAQINPKGQSTVWVIMKQQADLSPARNMKDWKARGQWVYDRLRQHALATQSGLRTFLDSRGARHEDFWIINAIQVTGDADTLRDLAYRPEVAKIVADEVLTLPTPIRGKTVPTPTITEWGLNNIRAPQVWSTFNVRGEGIVVANVDTGVQFNHPALVEKYRGRANDGTFNHNYNWFDPANVCGNPSLQPCDNAAHGTHTMGTMVGDDGNPGQNQIGVAPGAKWIAAKGCESNSCSLASLLASGQWLLAPTDLMRQNPRPDLRPHVINSSWGGGRGADFYQSIVQAWVASGMFPVFSAGNGGPGCGSAGSPGEYPESYGVAAHDVNNAIAGFSSRGPSSFGNVLKPNISGPGVDVRSSVPPNSYDVYGGTSMSAPHVAGTVALIWSAAPSLVGDIAGTRALLDRTAVNMNDVSCGGTPEANNVWGEGRLDAFAAVDQAPRGPIGTLAGTVTNASNGSAIADALVRATGPSNRNTSTSDTGAYSMTLPVGSYTVNVSAFGFIAQSFQGVEITEGNTTTRNAALQPAPSYTVSGVVRDPDRNPIAGAQVTILNTPIPAATTDAQGRYSFASVPAGSYEVSASGSRCRQGQTQELVVDGNETLDFSLPRRTDSFGYFCDQTSPSFIEASTVIPLTGDDASAPVTLPFPFTYYGNSHTTVNVSTNGFIKFGTPSTAYNNGSIPSPAEPNNAIYAFWDDMMVDAQGSVRTETVGSAPNRKFVVEWRNLTFYNNTSKRLSVEIVLSENGHIALQYKDVDNDPIEQGNSATIGIENADGTIGLQYSTNEAALRSGEDAIVFRLPPSGFIEGTVKDRNDNLPVTGAVVRVLSGETQVRAQKTSAAGGYRIQVPVGTYTVEAGYTDYSTERASVTVAEDQTVTQDFSLRTARAAATPGAFDIVVVANQTRTRTLRLSNTGSLPMEWSVGETGGGRARVVSTLSLQPRAGADPNARTTRDLYEGGPVSGWAPIHAGQVIRSFRPAGLTLGWGVGYAASNVWLSDVPAAKTNTEFTNQGAPTGRRWNATWASAWNGDMAYDTRHNMMCQVNVGGDNGIYCWNTATGEVGGSITGTFPWTSTSQRGLAYRPDDDSFYIGGWNQGVIYHVKGLSHADKGAVISQCNPSDRNISGLAWNASAEVLWMATNSATDTVYAVNAEDCTVLTTLAHPAPGNQGAGLELDEVGNLWMIGQNPNTAYLVDSGIPSFLDVPWLDVSPSSGTVAPGTTRNVTIRVNTNGMGSGVHLAKLFIQSNSGRGRSIQIPISLIVPVYQQGVISGGNDYTDAYQDRWSEDRRYRSGRWGYIRDYDTVRTRRDIARTAQDELFQTARIDPYAYRFDGLPKGVYKVELKFAEIDRARVGERVFDVIMQDSIKLPAHDIVYEVGEYTAENRAFRARVESDGRLDVKFIGRARSRERPLINALRVTHRPDWE